MIRAGVFSTRLVRSWIWAGITFIGIPFGVRRRGGVVMAQVQRGAFATDPNNLVLNLTGE
jgi:hypothetical protein